MRVWEYRDSEDRACSIEVSSLVGRRRVTSIVSAVEGVDVVRRPVALSWWREEVFCEFDLDGQRYQIDETFGDNSRYCIARNDEFLWHPSFHRVVEAFREAWPGPLLFWRSRQ